MNPLGSVTFLSCAWGGRSTDNDIVHESGVISAKYHHPRDQILADRGFTLVDDFAAACGAGKKQLAARDVEVTRKIANVRIHIERVIGNGKKRFGILSQGSLPINLVKSKTDEPLDATPNIEKLVTVCACLINLMPSIVYTEGEDYLYFSDKLVNYCLLLIYSLLLASSCHSCNSCNTMSPLGLL